MTKFKQKEELNLIQIKIARKQLITHIIVR
jgi:hypothetical protein